MRLFLAIPVTVAARGAASAIAGDVRRGLAARAIKWVEAENLHVTLRFLGEVDATRVIGLQSLLTPPLATRCFSLVLGGAGCFPSAGLPRVLWIGVSDGAAKARAVFAELEERLSSLEFPREARVYTPHLTLGRVREISREEGRRVRERLAQVAAPLATSRVDRVTLYRSHLTPSGSRYEALMEMALAAPAEIV